MKNCPYCQSTNIVVKPHSHFRNGMRECGDCGRKLGAAPQDLSKPENLGKIWFGKYAGMLWLDVPDDYLNWLLQNPQSARVSDFVHATLKHKQSTVKVQP